MSVWPVGFIAASARPLGPDQARLTAWIGFNPSARLYEAR